MARSCDGTRSSALSLGIAFLLLLPGRAGWSQPEPDDQETEPTDDHDPPPPEPPPPVRAAPSRGTILLRATPSAEASARAAAAAARKAARFEALIEADPDYQSGHARKTAGILVSAIGSGAGAISIVLGAAAMLLGCGFAGVMGDSNDGFWDRDLCRVPAVMMIAGGSAIGVSLVIGLPLLRSGELKMNEAHRRRAQEVLVPRLGLFPIHGGGGLGVGFRF